MKKGEYSQKLNRYYYDGMEPIFSGVSILAFLFYGYFAVTKLMTSPHIEEGFSVVGIVFTAMIAIAASIYYGTGTMIFLYTFISFQNMKEKNSSDYRDFYEKGISGIALMLFYLSLTFHLIIVDGKITFLSFLFSIVSYLAIFAFERKMQEKKYELAEKKIKKEQPEQPPVIKKENIEYIGFTSEHQSLKDAIDYVMKNKNLLENEDVHNCIRFIGEDIPNLFKYFNELDKRDKEELKPIVNGKLKEIETYFQSLVNEIKEIKRNKVEQSIQVIDKRLKTKS